ncbi:MAG: hypothetical protein WCN95_11370 [bacterium]
MKNIAVADQNNYGAPVNEHDDDSEFMEAVIVTHVMRITHGILIRAIHNGVPEIRLRRGLFHLTVVMPDGNCVDAIDFIRTPNCRPWLEDIPTVHYFRSGNVFRRLLEIADMKETSKRDGMFRVRALGQWARVFLTRHNSHSLTLRFEKTPQEK